MIIIKLGQLHDLNFNFNKKNLEILFANDKN